MSVKQAVVFVPMLAVLALSLVCCQSDSPGETVDILVVNGTVVTMDSNRIILDEGAVAIEDGGIVAVGTSADLTSEFKGTQTIDAEGGIVMPGLINTHTHAAMTILRGLADDLVLKDWLEYYIWPTEAAYIDNQTVRWGASLAVAEMIRSGTTTFTDMYFFEDTVAEVAKEAGIRVVIGESLMDFPTPNAKTPEEGLEYTEMIINKWKDDPLVTASVALHAPYTCSQELLKQGKALADRYDVPLQIHVSETEQEVSDMITEFGLTPFGYLDNLGILDDRVIAAHCVHLTEDDIRLIVDRKVGVAHDPQSNLKLASGISPIPALIEAGAEISIATDGAASNNDLNMFEEMGLTAAIHKAMSKDPTVVDASTVVELATIGGAKVLGLDDKIGSIEIGKRADIIIIDLDKPHLVPLFDPYSHIVYAIDGADVKTVIIEGRSVMRDYNLLTIDEDEIMDDVRELARQIKLNN